MRTLNESLTPQHKDRCSRHSTVECTSTLFTDDAGIKYLQLDTDGSKTRKIPGKVSQSLQFSPESLGQLRDPIDREFPDRPKPINLR